MKSKIMLVICCLLAGWLSAAAQTKYDKAQGLFDSKQYNEAIRECHVLISASPGDEQAWSLLAKSFLQIGQYDSAEQAAKKTIDLDDDIYDAYAVQTQAELALKKNDDALQAAQAGIDRLKKKKRDFPLMTLVFGQANLAAGKVDEALKAFTLYAEAMPADSRGFEGEADAYAKQGITTMAIIQYEKSLEIDSTQIPVLYKLANTYVADRQYTEAGRVYDRILALQPDNDAARLELANLYYRAKLWKPCAATLKAYFERVANPPRNIQSMYLESMYHSRYFNQALSLAESFLKSDPNHVIALRTASHAYAEKKEYQKSVDAMKKVEKLDTLQFDDYKLLGIVYRAMKNDEAALDVYLKAVSLDSVQPAIYGEIGSMYMSQKKWESAAAYLERRVKFDSSAVGAYINLGSCLMQTGEFDRAVSNFKKAISINPEYPPTYVSLANCYVNMRDFDEARDWCRKAVKVIDTQETKYRFQLADANKYIGLAYLIDKRDPDHPDKKYEDAVLYLERALKYKEDDAATHLWLGQSYQNLKKNEEAIKQYRRALKLDPNNKEAKSGLESLGE